MRYIVIWYVWVLRYVWVFSLGWKVLVGRFFRRFDLVVVIYVIFVISSGFGCV